MSSTLTSCPACHSQLRIPDTVLPGARVQCPKCHEPFTLSAESRPAASAFPSGSVGEVPAANPTADPPVLPDYSPDERGAPLDGSAFRFGDAFQMAGTYFSPLLGPMIGFTAILAGVMLVVFLVLFLPLGLTAAFLFPRTPAIGAFAGAILQSVLAAVLFVPLAAGYTIVVIRQIRGEPWEFGDFFGGFRYYAAILRLGAIQACAGLAIAILHGLLSLAVLGVPVLGPQDIMNIIQYGSASLISKVLLVSFVGWLLQVAVSYPLVRIGFYFFGLVVDRGYGGDDALKTSWNMTAPHHLAVWGFSLLAGLIALAGIVACCFPGLFSVPYAQLLLTVPYIQATSGRRDLPPPP
jgi:hypothetical protein